MNSNSLLAREKIYIRIFLRTIFYLALRGEKLTKRTRAETYETLNRFVFHSDICINEQYMAAPFLSFSFSRESRVFRSVRRARTDAGIETRRGGKKSQPGKKPTHTHGRMVNSFVN